MSKFLGSYLKREVSLPDKTIHKLKNKLEKSTSIPKEELNAILSNFEGLILKVMNTSPN